MRLAESLQRSGRGGKVAYLDGARKKKERAQLCWKLRPPLSSRSWVSFNSFHDGEHDHQRKDDQRLDEGETDDHQNLDASARARITRRTFGGRRRHARLTQRAQARRDGKADARRELRPFK